MTETFLNRLSTTKTAKTANAPRQSETRRSGNYSRINSNNHDCESNSDSSVDSKSRNYRQNNRESSKRYTRKRSDPTKWKLSFSGKDDGKGVDNIQDFIMRLEEHAHQDDIPKRELVTLMRNFVSGVADKWYFVFIRKNKNVSWRQLKLALLERFSSVESERAQRRYIRGRLQETRESFNDFILEIEMANHRLSRPLPEEEILEIVLDNMNPALKNATQDNDFDDIEDLRKACSNYEKLWSTSGYDPRKLIDSRNRRARVVEEVMNLNTEVQDKQPKEYIKHSTESGNFTQNDISDGEQHVNAFERRNNIIICWNCKDIGHAFTKCPMEKTHVFCYGCGLAGKSIDDCYRCQKRRSGNFDPNVHKYGEPRSEKPTVPRTLHRTPQNIPSTSQD